MLTVLSSTLLYANEKEFTVTVISYFDTDNTENTATVPADYADRLTIDTTTSRKGYTFAYWVVDGIVRFDVPIDNEFIIIRDMEIKAVFAKSDLHAVLFMDTNGELIGDVQYVATTASATAPSVAGISKPNHNIVLSGDAPVWSESLTDITENKVFILQYTLDVSTEFTLSAIESSVITSPNGADDKFIYNTIVEIEADAARAGEQFSHWLVNGQQAGYSTTIKITMLRNTTVEAIYIPAGETITESPTIYLSNDLEIRTSEKTYRSQFYIPQAYQLIDFGLIATDSATWIDIDKTTTGINVYQSTKFIGETQEFLTTYSQAHTLIRAYLVVEKEGSRTTIYSNLVSYILEGEGSEDEPYLIDSFAGMDLISNDLTASYKLTTDLTYDVSAGDGWDPIGDNEARFTGTFDGDGHTISNLYINRPTEDNVGLFGHIGVSSSNDPTTIKNICLIDVNVTGNRGTGALVGRVTGNQATLIQNSCVVGGTVSGTGATGGLVGSSNSFATQGAADRNPVIESSFAKVSVVGRGDDPNRTFEKIGGLVGCTQKGTVRDSYSLSTVTIQNGDADRVDRVGGLAGCNIFNGRIEKVYSAAFMNVNATESTAVGVLLGHLGDGNVNNRGNLPASSYFDNVIVINDSLPGIGDAGGNADEVNAIGLSTVNMQGSNAVTNMSAFDFDNVWQTTTKYPILRGIDQTIQLNAQDATIE